MSVFKEINSIINQINNAFVSNRIWNDSCDSGLPLTTNEGNWNNISYWLKAHTINGTKKKLYPGAHQITISTMEEHTTGNSNYYEITYFNHLTNKQNLIQQCDGYLTIRKIMPSEHTLINELNRLKYNMLHPNENPIDINH